MNKQNVKTISETKCDSVNHTRFPKENHLPDWARWDDKVTKGDGVESERELMCGGPVNVSLQIVR